MRNLLEQKLFYIYYIIMLLTKGLGLTDGPVYKLCIIVASAAALLKILTEQHTRKEYLVIIALLILGGVNWIHTGNQGALICILLVLVMKNIALADAFAVGAICWGLSYAIQIATQLLNLRQRDFVIHTKLGFRNIIRWGLGYTHPNVLQIATLALIAYVIYCVRYRTIRQMWSVIAVSLALSGYIFIYSLSITGMSMTIVFLFVLVYMEMNRFYGRVRGRIENLLLQCIFPICASFAVLGPLLLTGRAFDFLNRLMQTRPYLSRYFMTTYGISLFGAVYEDLPTNYTLDCSYVNLLMHGGIVLFGIMCAGYLWTIRYLLRQIPSRENSIMLAIVLYTVVGAISEPFAFNTSYKNVSLLILGSCMYCAMNKEDSKVSDVWSQGRGQIGGVMDQVLHQIYHVLITNNPYCVRFLVAALLSGVVFAGVYGTIHQAPQEVYALRIHGDDVDDYPLLYMTEGEIEALRYDDNNWIMEYQGPEEPMIHYSQEPIGQIEIVRTQISLCLFVTIAMYVVMSIIWSRQPGRYDHKHI